VVWSGDPNASHKASLSSEEKNVGQGRAIRTVMEFATAGIRLEQEFLLVDGDPGLLLTTRLTNLGKHPLTLDRVVTVEALAGSLPDGGQTAKDPP
jgi:hypothetical protein